MTLLLSKQKNYAIISDNLIIYEAIRNQLECSITFVGGNYNDFINSTKRIDLLIIDKEIEASEIPLFRINSLLNLTNIEITKNEIKLVKPFQLNKLLEILSNSMKDQHLFCCINENWIYHERESKLISQIKKISLTPKENAVLSALLAVPAFELRKRTLKNRVWNYHQDSESNTVETHLYKLKQKLPKDFLIIKGEQCTLNIKQLN